MKELYIIAAMEVKVDLVLLAWKLTSCVGIKKYPKTDILPILEMLYE
jgi:hypothetical protein